jgi:hypothetical protein
MASECLIEKNLEASGHILFFGPIFEFPWKTAGSTDKIVGVLAEIRAGHFPNRKKKR